MRPMPMDLLRTLSHASLPMDITDPDAWARLLVLERAGLICAAIPAPRSHVLGRRSYGTATVLSVTTAGMCAAGLNVATVAGGRR